MLLTLSSHQTDSWVKQFTPASLHIATHWRRFTAVAQFDGSKLPLNDVKPRSTVFWELSSALLVGKFDSNDKFIVTPYVNYRGVAIKMTGGFKLQVIV